MSDITPADVAADLFAAKDTHYDDSGNGWIPEIKANGNVVELAITPTDENGVSLDEKVHFRAVVVEVPASAPVAAEPVIVDGDTARELAYSDPGDTVAGWTVVANEHIESQRWESLHQLVIRNEQGEHFEDTYSKGLTEYQSTGAYEDADAARFTPVVPTFRVVTEWKAARKPAPAQTGGAE